jgi:YVTN family beta-propeller protein
VQVQAKQLIWLGAVVAVMAAVLKLASDPAPDGQLSLDDIDRYVFVPSSGAAEVTVIDRTANEVIAVIELPDVASQIVVSEVTGLLVSSHRDAGTLSMTDIGTGSVETIIDLGMTPQSLVMSPGGYWVAASNIDTGEISVIALEVPSKITRLDDQVDPAGVTFSAGGSLLYLPDHKSNSLKLADVVKGLVIGEIPLTAAPSPAAASGGSGTPTADGTSALTRSPDDLYGFCVIGHAQELVVFDFGAREKIKTLKLGRQPSRPYGTADGRYMLIANEGDRTVSVIDTITFEVAATLPGASDVTAINTGWFESVAFVISRSENRAVVLDLMKLQVAGEIPLDGRPGPGVVTADGAKLYVALAGSNSVAVINTRDRALETIITDVGSAPVGITMARTNNFCH